MQHSLISDFAAVLLPTIPTQMSKPAVVLMATTAYRVVSRCSDVWALYPQPTAEGLHILDNSFCLGQAVSHKNNNCETDLHTLAPSRPKPSPQCLHRTRLLHLLHECFEGIWYVNL